MKESHQSRSLWETDGKFSTGRFQKTRIKRCWQGCRQGESKTWESIQYPRVSKAGRTSLLPVGQRLPEPTYKEGRVEVVASQELRTWVEAWGLSRCPWSDMNKMLQPHFFPSLRNPALARLYWKPEIKGTLEATLHVGLSGPTEAGEEWRMKLEMQTKDTQSKSQENSPQSQSPAFQIQAATSMALRECILAVYIPPSWNRDPRS